MYKKIETKFDAVKNQYYMLIGNDWQAITPLDYQIIEQNNIDIEMEKLGYIRKSKKGDKNNV